MTSRQHDCMNFAVVGLLVCILPTLIPEASSNVCFAENTVNDLRTAGSLGCLFFSAMIIYLIIPMSMKSHIKKAYRQNIRKPVRKLFSKRNLRRLWTWAKNAAAGPSA